jgi:predicted transposase/invertase (TIGR01784 family)
MVMKHIFDKNIMEVIIRMIENNILTINNLGEDNFLRTIIYILEQKNVNIKKTVDVLKKKNYEKEASKMLTTAEKLRQEGWQEGRKEERKKAESKIKTMVKLLLKAGYDKVKIKTETGLSDRELNKLLPQT